MTTTNTIKMTTISETEEEKEGERHFFRCLDEGKYLGVGGRGRNKEYDNDKDKDKDVICVRKSSSTFAASARAWARQVHNNNDDFLTTRTRKRTL